MFSSSKNQYAMVMLSCLLLAVAAFGMLNFASAKALPMAAHSTTTATTKSTTTTISYPSQFFATHVIVILLENENSSYVIGNKDAPYLNTLIRNYSMAERYYAVGHPSLLNYIAMTSGSTMGVPDNEYPTRSLPYSNLVDLFSSRNITWKAYMESMPSNQKGSCNNALVNQGGTYGYFTKHDPFVYFTDITSNMSRCSRIVSLTQFGADLANNQLPEFSFITPNILNDGHTVPPNATTCAPSGTTLRCSDNWLSSFMPKIISDPIFANTIVFITWDENLKGTETTNAFPNNKVLLLTVSPHSRKGFADNTTIYSHYSLLATIEEIFSLGNLGRNDTTANTLDNLFINGTAQLFAG